MMIEIEKQKQQLVTALLAKIPMAGYSNQVIAMVNGTLGFEDGYEQILFPGGIDEIISYYNEIIENQVLEQLALIDLSSYKVREKIFLVCKLWIEQYLPHRAALKRIGGFYLVPTHTTGGCKQLWHIADQIWYLCGDNATDFNYYTKRILLSGVYASTYCKWLNDTSEQQKDSWLFLTDRINNVLAIGKYKAKFKGFINSLKPL